jgi:hypothetical protein
VRIEVVTVVAMENTAFRDAYGVVWNVFEEPTAFTFRVEE